jgi:hypothetical protein
MEDFVSEAHDQLFELTIALARGAPPIHLRGDAGGLVVVDHDICTGHQPIARDLDERLVAEVGVADRDDPVIDGVAIHQLVFHPHPSARNERVLRRH